VDEPTRAERHRRKTGILERLERVCGEDDRTIPAIDREVARLNGDADALDALLARQHYRVAFWRTAARELDYRRFFDINDLVALRVEDAAVFDAVHERTIELARERRIDGVRVDHVDGLRDPAGYLERLRAALGPDAWILVEKILHHEERLRGSWPVDGSTGYEAIDVLAGVFVDPRGEAAITRTYATTTGESRPFAEIAHTAKHEAMRTLLTADVERVTALFVQVCERHRRHRDHTRADLREAIRETVAALAVYRTYARAAAGAIDDEDRRWIDGAIGTVSRRRRDIDRELLRFLRSLLLLELRGEVEDELVMRFQQLTAPVTAKGVEDTALYRYSRLVARNEVGSDPGRWSVGVAELHRAARERLGSHPHGLVAVSTHDTKRSADVRARLALLSEIPDRWAEALAGWTRRNERYRSGGMPDREDEHLLYQTLVGAHPLPLERALAYVEKAAREAKRATSWTAPNEGYEDALASFVRGVYGDDAFAADLDAFARPLVAAGRMASLAQTLLQLTVPGVPDIYQGNELWDLSLVDPDSRRPVDFDVRRRALDETSGLGADAIMARMDEGLPKLHVVRRALAARARRPDVFERGAHVPLPVEGTRADHAIAFARGDEVAVVVPRLVIGLYGDRPGRADAWADTEVRLPEGRWCEELTGRPERGGARRLAEILSGFPVALLVRDSA
jgi:(1->4)-alpha-D-glucan 1-alpha-D-glucosylmutase